MTQPPSFPPEGGSGVPQNPNQGYPPPPPSQMPPQGGQPPYQQPGYGYGYPQAQPAADNPYAQPQMPGPPQPAGYGYPQQGYGGYPPQGGPMPGGPGGSGKKKTGIIVAAAVGALVLIGGGIFVAVSAGDDGDDKPAAKESAGQSAEASTGSSPSASPSESASETVETDPTPTESDVLGGGGGTTTGGGGDTDPTGTGVDGVWMQQKGFDTKSLAITGAGVGYVAGESTCSGLNEKKSSTEYSLELTCDSGTPKTLNGTATLNGDTLTVKWEGGNGTDTFERYDDI